MRKVIAFFVRYPIWTNVLMFSILGFGLLSFRAMKYSFFPEIPPDMIMVEVELIGGSPEEVEEGVVIKIEENIEGIEGIERVTSVSRESSARVIVEVMKGENVDKVLQDVKNAVDRISSFPRATEKPVIYERKYRDDVLSIVLLGDTDLFNLKYVADEMRDELLAMPELSQVTISGLPRLEFSIEVREADLRRYLFTFDEIAQAVAAANINISGGKLETPEEEILIRTWGRKYYANQLNGLVVRGNPDGTVLRLSDIAKVKEKWEDIPDKVFYNTRNAVKVRIEKTGREDILAIGEKVKKYLTNFNEKNSNIEA
ncbi:MAG: efflux RND transporter permease subunit, partial [Thermodesulfobacteriota bacterium]|nr:efflux RND transporter permease subunit [Thermodesulfobacteriota bacterium]